MFSPRKKAAEVADRIKAEVARAGDAVQAAIAIAVLALVIAVVALVTGLRSRHAG
jgi:lipopolysaccharide/colanic/teichoic acid biosynthesis glycosyltransferase